MGNSNLTSIATVINTKPRVPKNNTGIPNLTTIATIINIKPKAPDDRTQEYNRQYTQDFYEQYFRSPCKCCGSNKHALLTKSTSNNNQNKITKYRCPVVDEYPDPSQQTEMEMLATPYFACQNKFAKQYNYDVNILEKAIKLYREQGIGRILSEARFANFKRNVYWMCKSHQEIPKITHESMTLLDKDCYLCGSKKHAALTPHITENGTTTLQYQCPLAAQGNWEKARLLADRFLKYSLCPIKFAKEHSYSFPQIQTAIDTFRKSRAYRKWPPRDIEKFETDVLQICKENQNHNSPKFYNSIQSFIHNFIKSSTLNSTHLWSQNKYQLWNKDLLWLIIHNLLIFSSCITVILLINVILPCEDRS